MSTHDSHFIYKARHGQLIELDGGTHGAVGDCSLVMWEGRGEIVVVVVAVGITL